MKVLELYSGIGGMHYALSASGVPGTVVLSMDINTIANEVYKHNFPGVRNISRNIESLSVKEIEKLGIDTILMSPPCQPFTRVGRQMDAKDNRCLSLLHLLSLIAELKNLKHILLENVKGFEVSETREQLVSCLTKSGFHYREIILSPCQFGVPNTRRRYYLLAKKKAEDFCFNSETVADSLPSEIMSHLLVNNVHSRLAREDEWAEKDVARKTGCYRLERVIEKNVDIETHSPPAKLLEKRTSVLDIRTPESRGSCCFTKAYGRYIEGTGSIFSPLSRESVDEKLSKVGRLRDSGEDFSEPLSELKLRFFTPKEVARLMCFPESFDFPNSITNRQRYRLLGNSINVHVVGRLIYLLNQQGANFIQDTQSNDCVR